MVGRSIVRIAISVFAVVCVIPSLAPVQADLSCATAATVCSQEEIDAIPVARYANPNWAIQLTPAGYSDIVIYDDPPFPRWDPRDPGGPAPLHEMFSGEWAAAIAYNGMSPMWLEKCMRYPEWKTLSNFMIDSPVMITLDLDSDGLLEGSSMISNGNLEITIDYDFEDTGNGVAMGVGPLGGAQYRMSDRFVLHQTYNVRNISGATITDVSVFQFSAPHPANTEGSTADIAYDDMMHSMGAHTSYRYDITGVAINSGLIDGYPTGSSFDDQVSFSSAMMPSAYGLGSYRGHLPGDNGLPDPPTGSLKPVEGLHCNVELDALGMETSLLQDEVAGAMKFDLGDLAPDETKSVTVLLALNSIPSGIGGTCCLSIENGTADPTIMIDKGACSGGVTAGPYDVVMGSLSELRLVPGCSPSFDCVALTNLRCLGQDYDMDRIDLDFGAHPTDPLYFLARRSFAFTSWGQGRNLPSATLPLNRFYFTPTTALGIDACEPVP